MIQIKYTHYVSFETLFNWFEGGDGGKVKNTVLSGH